MTTELPESLRTVFSHLTAEGNYRLQSAYLTVLSPSIRTVIRSIILPLGAALKSRTLERKSAKVVIAVRT